MNLGFQMILVIVAFSYLGVYLDGKFETGPMLTALFSLLGVGFGLYYALKDFLFTKK